MKGKMEKPNLCDNICKGVEVPSDDEVEALKVMKALKLRVREIKKRISDLSSAEKDEDSRTKSVLEEDLKQLKKEWDQWEEKRSKAAKERMIMLGHEEDK